jgi:predicted nucleic acid-binding protein
MANYPAQQMTWQPCSRNATTQTQQCVDASFIVALLIPEKFSPAALELWQAWVEEDQQPAAPLLLRYEATSALYRKALRDQVSTLDARLALAHFLNLDIEWIDTIELSMLRHRAGWVVSPANHLRRPLPCAG